MGKLQEFYDKRYEKGLCIYCGKNPYTPDKKTCQDCRAKKKKSKALKKLGKSPLHEASEDFLYSTACITTLEHHE